MQSLKNAFRKNNKLGIGPQGMGGTTTALAVNVETFPTHIAGLPVAVNVNCHATRHTVENYIKFEPAWQVDIKLNNLVRIIMRL